MCHSFILSAASSLEEKSASNFAWYCISNFFAASFPKTNLSIFGDSSRSVINCWEVFRLSSSGWCSALISSVSPAEAVSSAWAFFHIYFFLKEKPLQSKALLLWYCGGFLWSWSHWLAFLYPACKMFGILGSFLPEIHLFPKVCVPSMLFHLGEACFLFLPPLIFLYILI